MGELVDDELLELELPELELLELDELSEDEDDDDSLPLEVVEPVFFPASRLSVR